MADKPQPLTSLVIPGHGEIQLPTANTDGAFAVLTRIDRMPHLVPRGADCAAIVGAIAVEVNKPELRDLRSGPGAISVVVAAFNIACLGLAPGAAGYVHIVPFKGKAQVIVGYKGWRELAYRNNFLSGFQCEVVMDEEFEHRNTERGVILNHDLSDPDRKEDWGKVRMAYCSWHSQDGYFGVGRVGQERLLSLRSRLGKKAGSAWREYPCAMAKKTAMLQARKAWRATDEIASAGILDDCVDRDVQQPALQGVAEVVDPTPESTPLSLQDYVGGDDPPTFDRDTRMAAFRSQITAAKGVAVTLADIMEAIETDLDLVADDRLVLYGEAEAAAK